MSGVIKKANKPSKSANYSPKEMEVLVTNVREHKAELFGSFTNTITHSLKERLWDEITQKMNAVGKSVRTVKLVKKKWSDMTSRARNKAAALKRHRNTTGKGGCVDPGDVLTPLEQQVVDIVGERAVTGHEDGLDTMPPETDDTINDTTMYDDPINNTIMYEENAYLSDSDGSLDNLALPVESASTSLLPPRRNIKKSKTQGKKSCDDEDGYTKSLLHIEKERLEIAKEDVKINVQRLEVEREIAGYLSIIANRSEHSSSLPPLQLPMHMPPPPPRHSPTFGLMDFSSGRSYTNL